MRFQRTLDTREFIPWRERALAACVVCDRPILNPVTLPSGKLCHERCYEEALKKERLAAAKTKGRSAPRPTPPSHPAIRRKPVEEPDDDG